ncbi:MAG: potassium transporter TrkG [Nitrososphaerales archaeon]
MREKPSGTLHNLGLILQMNGIALLAPVIIALIFNEGQALTALVLSAFSSLFVGFFLTNLSEEGEMHFESICTLMIMTFLLLGIIGAIPYVYLGEQIFGKLSFDKIFVNGFFESISGFTTTGLTTLLDIEALPKSIILFRGLSQWIGGIGIVYMMILFLGAPGETVRAVGELSGFEKIKPSFRGTFWQIMKIYTVYTLIFTLLLFFLGGVDIFTSVNLVFTGISTGGFLPVNDLGLMMTPATMGIIVVMMIFGATSFSVHDNLWTGEVRKILTYEYKFYLSYVILIAVLFGLLFSSAGKAMIDIPFHLISAATTTGFQFISFDTANPLKSLMILIMFVGGGSFSAAGGIKMVRFIMTTKAVPWAVRRVSLPARAITPLKMGGKALFEKDVLTAFLLIGLGVFSIFVFSIFFSFYGYDLLDSIFELASAFGTVGLSTGITEVGLPTPLKVILAFEMVIGRVEVIPFLVFIRQIIHR